MLPRLLFLALLPIPLAAQSRRVPDLPPLAFLGLQAGAPLSEVRSGLRRLGDAGLRCENARADSTVSECRASLTEPQTGRPLELWLAALDSVSAVLTISGPVTADQLASWRTSLERSYGPVRATSQGSQRMMQWVRRGRMIRLTWRSEQGERVASVSLVDGRALDAWGRSRSGFRRILPERSDTGGADDPASRP